MIIRHSTSKEIAHQHKKWRTNIGHLLIVEARCHCTLHTLLFCSILYAVGWFQSDYLSRQLPLNLFLRSIEDCVQNFIEVASCGSSSHSLNQVRHIDLQTIDLEFLKRSFNVGLKNNCLLNSFFISYDVASVWNNMFLPWGKFSLLGARVLNFYD